MFIKVLLISSCITFAFAKIHHHASSYTSIHSIAIPDHQHHGESHHEEHYAHHRPKYAYKYGVEDEHTGDYKSQREHHDGDSVKGEYMVIQPDGRIRTVHYTADKHAGFNAYVDYSGHAIHPEDYSHEEHHSHEQYHDIH